LRGVGKTVLLNKVLADTQAKGIQTVSVETPEDQSLLAIMIPGLRSSLLRLSRGASTKDYASKSLRALGSFVNAVRLKLDDDVFLHTAWHGNAQWLVSGDKDLLELPSNDWPFEILSPDQFLYIATDGA